MGLARPRCYLGWTRHFAAVLRRHARLARQDTGKSVWSQAAEIVRLAADPGRLDPDESYQYRLYDHQRFTWPQKLMCQSPQNGLGLCNLNRSFFEAPTRVT